MSDFTIYRDKFKRVSRDRVCPICGRPDWCLVSDDAAICARIESDHLVGSEGSGWLHRLRDRDDYRPVRCLKRLKIDGPAPDFASIVADCEQSASNLMLADSLGISLDSLSRLCTGWSDCYRGYCFPMKDATGRIRGIRLRSKDGRKWSVRGGHEGLFIPAGLPTDSKLLLICEGPTDTAALLDLGFSAIGRPSCTGGVSHILGFILRDAAERPQTVVVVADDDGPGFRGAWKLASKLVAYVRSVRVISPPAGMKDARQWKQNGAERQDILQVIDDAAALEIRYPGAVVI